MNKVKKAVIPAAGLGTRFLPATKAQPKEMLPIVDIPIIQYVIEEAVASGIEDVLIITGRGKRAIEDHFDRSIELEAHLEHGQKAELLERVRDISNIVDIHFIRQKEALGLGHAILQARRHVGNEPFAVLLGDEIFRGPRPCMAQLLTEYQRTGGCMVGVKEVAEEEVSRYGVIKPVRESDRIYRVADLVEKPSKEEAPSRMAVIGRYVLPPDIFEVLAVTPPGKNGEIQLTDAIRRLLSTTPVYGCDPECKRYDVGEKLGYVIATIELGLERDDMREGLLDYLKHLKTAHTVASS